MQATATAMEQYKQMQAEREARLREERVRAVYERELNDLASGNTANQRLQQPEF